MRDRVIPMPKRPATEADIRALEARIEARGNGVAGGVVTPQNSGPMAPHEPSTKPGTRRNPRVRRDGVATRSTSVHLPVDLAKRLARHCAETERRQSEVIAEALERLLA
jgi:hypothetical protein